MHSASAMLSLDVGPPQSEVTSCGLLSLQPVSFCANAASVLPCSMQASNTAFSPGTANVRHVALGASSSTCLSALLQHKRARPTCHSSLIYRKRPCRSPLLAWCSACSARALFLERVPRLESGTSAVDLTRGVKTSMSLSIAASSTSSVMRHPVSGSLH